MKIKILSMLLICVVLASCTINNIKQGTGSSSIDLSLPSAEGLSLNPADEAPLSADESGSYLASSRKAVAQLYAAGKISDTAYALFYSLLSGTNQYQNTVLSHFKLTFNEKQYAENKELFLEFTVQPIDYAAVPAGEYSITLYDTENITLHKENGKSPENVKSIELLKAYFSETSNYEVIIGTDLSAFKQGSTAQPYEITSVTRQDGLDIVDVQFYADCLYLSPSILARYGIDDNGIVRSFEIILYSNFSPKGFFKSAEKMREEIPNAIADIAELKSKNPLMAAILQCDIKALAEVNHFRYSAEMHKEADTFTATASDIKIDEWLETAIVRLNITQSNNINYPLGTSDYSISTGLGGSLRKLRAENRTYSPTESTLTRFFECMGSEYYTLENLESSDTLADYVLKSLSLRFPQKSSFTASEVNEYAFKYLGVEQCLLQGRYEAQESGKYSFLARGGYSVQYSIESSGTREYPEFTVQFYADDARLVRSHKIKYKLRLIDSDYQILSAEMLQKSEFEPVRWGI